MPSFLDRLLGREDAVQLTREQIDEQQQLAGRLHRFQEKYATQWKTVGDAIDRAGIKLRDPSFAPEDRALLLANAEDDRRFFRRSAEEGPSGEFLKATLVLQSYMDAAENLIWSSSSDKHLLYRQAQSFFTEGFPAFRERLRQKPELAATMQPAYDQLMDGIETTLVPLLKDIKRFRLASREGEINLLSDDPVGDRAARGR